MSINFDLRQKTLEAWLQERAVPDDLSSLEAREWVGWGERSIVWLERGTEFDLLHIETRGGLLSRIWRWCRRIISSLEGNQTTIDIREIYRFARAETTVVGGSVTDVVGGIVKDKRQILLDLFSRTVGPTTAIHDDLPPLPLVAETFVHPGPPPEVLPLPVIPEGRNLVLRHSKQTMFPIKKSPIVVANGNIYSVGSSIFDQHHPFANVFDQEELDGVSADIHKPRKLNFFEKLAVTVVSFCDDHALVVADSKLYTFGKGSFGQLGHGDILDRFFPTAVKDFSGHGITEVFSSINISMCIANGRLFTFGKGNFGQLGHGDRSDRLKPTLVEALKDEVVVAISSGGGYSMALTNKGQVFTFGRGDDLQITHGDILDRLEPTPVEALKDEVVVAISGGFGRSMALTKDGYVFSSVGKICKKIKCLMQERVVGISVKLDRSMVLTKSGRALILGSSDSDFLDRIFGTAYSVRAQVNLPEGLNIKQIASGVGCFMMATDCGKLFKFVVSDAYLERYSWIREYHEEDMPTLTRVTALGDKRIGFQKPRYWFHQELYPEFSESGKEEFEECCPERAAIVRAGALAAIFCRGVPGTLCHGLQGGFDDILLEVLSYARE